jgi:hypothetical protein
VLLKPLQHVNSLQIVSCCVAQPFATCELLCCSTLYNLSAVSLAITSEGQCYHQNAQTRDNTHTHTHTHTHTRTHTHTHTHTHTQHIHRTQHSTLTKTSPLHIFQQQDMMAYQTDKYLVRGRKRVAVVLLCRDRDGPEWRPEQVLCHK